jgi:hypothetical protein
MKQHITKLEISIGIAVLIVIAIAITRINHRTTIETPINSQNTLSENVSMQGASSSESSASDPFFAELDEADAAHVLEMLSTADGAYTDACYARLANLLIQEPDSTLSVLVQNLQNNPQKDQILHSLGTELYYVPQNEEKEQLQTYLSSLDSTNTAYEVSLQILDAWQNI